jgi:hypothetical protein
MNRFVFPRWANKTVQLAGVILGGAPVFLICLIWYGASPKTTDVGYQPHQPVPYSHALHAGELGIDCRYCHNTVEQAGHAAIPPTETCMNCHQRVKVKSAKLEPIRKSWTEGTAVEWKKVHDLPDYVYFNHSAHVTRGVGCESCHGRIDQAVKVGTVAPLTMGWCLDCHRNPEPNLRKPENVTAMGYRPGPDEGAKVRSQLKINPPTDCSTCHR